MTSSSSSATQLEFVSQCQCVYFYGFTSVINRAGADHFRTPPQGGHEGKRALLRALSVAKGRIRWRLP